MLVSDISYLFSAGTKDNLVENVKEEKNRYFKRKRRKKIKLVSKTIKEYDFRTRAIKIGWNLRANPAYHGFELGSLIFFTNFNTG